MSDDDKTRRAALDSSMAKPFKVVARRPADPNAVRAKGRPAPEDDPNAPVCYTFSHPLFGHVAGTRDDRGKAWVCAGDYIGAYAGAVLGELYPPLWTCPEDLAADIFKSVPARFKASKRFHTSEGYRDRLGITPEGLMFYHGLNDRISRGGPGLRLVR